MYHQRRACIHIRKSIMKTRCDTGRDSKCRAVQRPKPRAPPVMIMFLLLVDGMSYVCIICLSMQIQNKKLGFHKNFRSSTTEAATQAPFLYRFPSNAISALAHVCGSGRRRAPSGINLCVVGASNQTTAGGPPLLLPPSLSAYIP